MWHEWSGEGSPCVTAEYERDLCLRSLKKITVLISWSGGCGFDVYSSGTLLCCSHWQMSDCWVSSGRSDMCASLNTSSLWGSYGYSPQEWCHLALFLSMCESEPVYSQTLVLLCLLASWVEQHSVSRAHSQFHCLAAVCVLCLTEQCWWWKTRPLWFDLRL